MCLLPYSITTNIMSKQSRRNYNSRRARNLRFRLWFNNGGSSINGILYAPCHYCNIELPMINLTIDHKLAKSKGGSRNYSNLTLACQPCNNLKDDKPYYEMKQAIHFNPH